MTTRDEYVETIKTAALAMGKELVTAYIIGQMPFFSIPFIKQVLSFVVGQILGVAIFKTELGAFFLFIDFRTSAQGRAFYDAAIKNRDTQANGTPEEKQRAEADAINAFRALVKFTN